VTHCVAYVGKAAEFVMTAVVNEPQNAVAPTPPSLTIARRQLSRLQTRGLEMREALVDIARVGGTVDETKVVGVERKVDLDVEATTGFELEATADVEVEVSEPTLPIATQEQAELI
jgi:hypothetical protein